ncbi:MAG: CdvA-like protein [Acidilobaceae archaeon]
MHGLSLRVEVVSQLVGQEVEDSYGRVLGILVSFNSDVNGNVRSIEIKVADKGLDSVEGDRLQVTDGKLTIIPEWKYEALKVIEALDRAYRRRRALETLTSGSDIPAEIVENLKRVLNEEIKNLKIRAEKVGRMIKDRLATIEDESLHISKAIVDIQTLYFSGEVGEKSYTQSMNHLKKLREKLIEEKNDAKKTLDKLEKTVEATITQQPPQKPIVQQEQKPQPQPQKQDTQQTPVPVVVKVEEA